MDTDDKLPMDQMDGAGDQQQPIDQQPQDQSSQVPRDEHGKFAPRGQPNEEHARRREAQERDEWRKKAEETEARFNTLNKRLEDMAALVKGDDPNAPPADPLAPVLEKIEGIDKRLSEADQRVEEERIQHAVRSYADEDEARFRQQQPDFPNAVSHYIQSRVAEMKAFGVPEEQAGQALAQEAQQLLLTAAQAGQSPAQIMYAMAQARGYQPQQAPNPAAGQYATAQQDNVYRMPQQNAGGRSFGNGAGAAGNAMTLQQIAAMSEEDYNAFRATPEGQRAIRRAQGG